MVQKSHVHSYDDDDDEDDDDDDDNGDDDDDDRIGHRLDTEVRIRSCK